MTRAYMMFATFLLTGLLFCMPLSAQDVTFQASVDKNPVGEGEQFTLSFTLSNAAMGSNRNIQLPDLGKFHIMAGPNQSSSMQFINGAITSSIVYSYVLQPKEQGRFTIGAASIEAGGKTYKTEPVTIEVVKGAAAPKQQQPGVPDDISAQLTGNVYMKAEVDRSRVQQGEQINLVFKLYWRVNLSNYTVSKNPSFTGFWGEDIENPRNISATTEVIDGKQFRVGVLRKIALFPTQSGTLEISPMEVQTTVQVQSRRSLDPFDAFFRDPFGQSVNYMVKSDPLKVRVDPLPRGAPTSFKGAVGRFTMNTTVDKRTTQTNEPISLKVTISGTGNVKLLEAPALELPVDFEQYTPKVSENINRQQERISGSKTFEYLLIPRYPGQKTIKPVTFSFYDINKKDYLTLTSAPIELTVEQGAAIAGPHIGGGSRADVQMLSQDIRFIKVGQTTLVRRGEYFHTSGLFVVMLLLPLLGFAVVVVYARQRQAEMSDEAGYRNRRAIKVAQTGLKRAGQLLKSPDSPEQKLQFYSEVARAMWKYLGDKMNIPPSEMSIERVVSGLAGRKVNGSVPEGLRALLETCEMARFAPTSLEQAAMQQTYDEARKIIITIERTLKSA